MKDDLLKIINYYGYRHQLRKFNEETFELIEAITIGNDRIDFLSKSHCVIEEYINHIEEEFADIMVLLSQFKYYFELDNEKIKKIMEEKIARQLERMKNE